MVIKYKLQNEFNQIRYFLTTAWFCYTLNIGSSWTPKTARDLSEYHKIYNSCSSGRKGRKCENFMVFWHLYQLHNSAVPAQATVVKCIRYFCQYPHFVDMKYLSKFQGWGKTGLIKV